MVIRARLMHKHEPNTETRRNVMPTYEEAIHTDVESLNKLSVASLVLLMAFYRPGDASPIESI